MTTSMRVQVPEQSSYPRKLGLKRRRSVEVRPMGVEDADARHRFFCDIPEEDLLFLRRDVTDRQVIEGWAQDVATAQTYTLPAE